MANTPSALWCKLSQMSARTAGMGQDLDDLLHEVGKRKRLGLLLKARRLHREFAVHLSWLAEEVAQQDLGT